MIKRILLAISTYVVFALVLMLASQSSIVQDALSERSEASKEMTAFINDWSNHHDKPIPDGLYQVEMTGGNGVVNATLHADYLFQENKVTIQAELKARTLFIFPSSLSISSSADYSVNNGFITYSNAKGHKVVFPDHRTPYEVSDDSKVITLYEDVDGVIKKNLLIRSE